MKHNFWAKLGKREKYGNRKQELAGHSFDSKLEKGLFDLLSLQASGGELRDLTHHPKTVYLSEARVIYKPDFSFINCATSEEEWAEAKGFETSDWRIKRRLWISYGPGKLHIYKGSAGRLTLIETLEPKQGGENGDNSRGLGTGSADDAHDEKE